MTHLSLTDPVRETVLEVYPGEGGAIIHMWSTDDGTLHIFNLKHEDAHHLVGMLYEEIRTYDNQERHDND